MEFRKNSTSVEMYTVRSAKVVELKVERRRLVPSVKGRELSRSSRIWALWKCRCSSLAISAEGRVAWMRKTVLLAEERRLWWSLKVWHSMYRRAWQMARRSSTRDKVNKCQICCKVTSLFSLNSSLTMCSSVSETICLWTLILLFKRLCLATKDRSLTWMVTSLT